MTTDGEPAVTTAPQRRWPTEYQLLLERAEELSRELGQFDAATGLLEQRLDDLEQELRARGLTPERDDFLAALLEVEREAAASRSPAAPLSLSALLVSQFLAHVESLSRALGKHESQTGTLEQRLARLSGQF